ncbi:MAG: UMP kinase [Candidatus Pacebacteria bacterium]|nr:UMP kinase [Candidatus Paceibacterota bacterium]
MEETIIISLGGSLIIPEEIDINFLKDFKSLISAQVNKRFFIITGGGKVCRKYQNAAKEISNPTNDELDIIGIKALNLNAELVRVLFKNDSHVNIYGAEKPGSSTDLGAVILAKEHGAKKVINLSNIDFAYDKDPNKFPDAKKIEKISWPEYRSLIPAEWNPGLSTPFDPIASKMAEEGGMEVVILNGKNISNLEKCLNGEVFIGTHIK